MTQINLIMEKKIDKDTEAILWLTIICALVVILFINFRMEEFMEELKHEKINCSK